MSPEEVVLQGLAYGLTSPSLEVKDAGQRKGRGVFATRKLEKGEYLCEYQTTKVYHPKKREKYEREYEANNEASYLLETQYGRKLVFDATRSYDQFGRYINHSSTHHNCRYWRPLLVRGKWRVGFIATRDIDEGEELCYDYGVRGMSWMVGESPKKPAVGRQKFSSERYRRRKFCPVPGCMVTKPLKKLSNHLSYRHPGLSKQDRADFLAKAKPAGASIAGPVQTPAPSQASLSSFFHPLPLSTPAVSTSADSTEPQKKKGRVGRKGKAPAAGRSRRRNRDEPQATSGEECEETPSSSSHRMGSTRHYPSFEVAKSRFLSSLADFATDRFGLAMGSSQAGEMLTDVSKFLYYAGHGEECVGDLHDTDKVKSYLQKLEADGISCSGQLTKLQRIESALRFAKSANRWSETRVGTAIDAILLWKKRLQKDKTAMAKKKAPRLSEELQELGNYSAIITMDEPRVRVERALSGPAPQPTEFDAATAYIAMLFYIKCIQRKSVVENMTMAEYTAATEEEEGHWVVTVSRHKTASSRGPAHLVMDSSLKDLCDRYLVLRKDLGSSPNLLVDHNGCPPTNLPRLVQNFAKEYNVRFPTPTQLRKAVGTAACKLPQGKQEKVAAFMKHSLQTQRRYYRALESQKHSLEAFNIVNTELLPASPATPLQKKRMYTDIQEARIRQYFQHSIKNSSHISLSEATAFLTAYPMEGRTPKNIQDKVRTIIRQAKK